MAYEVDVASVEAQPLMVVKARANFSTLPATIRASLDALYDEYGGFNRETMGHNVVLYRPDGGPDLMNTHEGNRIDIGVQAKPGLQPQGDLARSQLPAGRAAHAVQWGGDYSLLHEAHAAIQAYCANNGHKLVGTNWEIYGDWFDDRSKVRVDVFYLLAS
jgi:hypothetical protein